MDDIKFKINEELAKKIIGNRNNAVEYLTRLDKVLPIQELRFRESSLKINAGMLCTSALWELIVRTWDYSISKDIIRDMFKCTEKYKNGKNADSVMKNLVEEWKSLNMGDITWPFSQGAFDEFVQRINADTAAREMKDEKVKSAAVKYRRIKEINTARNDFIETLIFEKNEIITPTLNHRRGVDFFINGISFDQKVAKSPTAEFKRKYGENWRTTAINNPLAVAEYLYACQDEGRFGAEPRLLVVYIDEYISFQQIRDIILKTDLEHYSTVEFSYKHKAGYEKTYQTPCFVILLYN